MALTLPSRPSGHNQNVEFRDETQWTRTTDSADCYSADGRYFLAFAIPLDDEPCFLVLNAAHEEER